MPTSFEICRQSVEAVYEDLTLLGVRLTRPAVDIVRPEDLWKSIHTKVVLSKSAHINHINYEQTPSMLGTTFGKRVVEMLETTEMGKFARKVPRVGNHACEYTESRFLQAAGQLTDSVAPDDPLCPKPILVMHHDKLCGLLKFVGDNTFLGLQDTPGTPILEGGVYGLSSDVGRLRKVAKEQSQTSIVEYSDIMDTAGEPDALRPSYFALGSEVLSAFTDLLRKPVPTIEQVRTHANTYIATHRKMARRCGLAVLAAFHNS